MRKTCLVLIAATLIAPSFSFAWGKRGHAIVCEAAADLAAKDSKNEFLRSHSFDLGYYCNVPDLVWKKPATYELESSNHFMDLEIFDRAFKKRDSDVKKAYEMDRLSFNAAFPEIEEKAGRSFWRIRELDVELGRISEKLKSTTLEKSARHNEQAQWLVVAGAIGHYIGDLAQPLHVSENYDGQLSGQKGVHSHFEEKIVDALFHGKKPGDITRAVMSKANDLWRRENKRISKLSTLDLMQELASDSNRSLKQVLDIDKKVGRTSLEKAAERNKDLIVERMAKGAVYLAEIWRRQTGFEFNTDKFYNFETMPAFIAPPKAP